VSGKRFGTDGIRGVANRDLSPELAYRLGRAAGDWILSQSEVSRVVIGRDTRRSGAMLEAALASGFCSVGVDVTSIGIAPTPTVSYVARNGRYSLGVIVSASHNPAPDNGIKLVGHDGRKLSDEVESEIESLIERGSDRWPTGAMVGLLEADRSEVDGYLDYLVSIVPEGLGGMKVAVDASHGAAFQLAPEVLIRLGAEVMLMGAEPDGMNINAEGGATKPEQIQAFTTRTKADVGVAFDGDADRAVFSDDKGRLINGDRTIGIWSAHWRANGRLEPPIVVGTVMSNGGFEKYLNQSGIHLERTPVGDKYVARKLSETGAHVGGEQSGHIIFPERGPTGDGLITMLELLRVLKREGRPASSFYDDYQAWPQLLVNVEVADRSGWNLFDEVGEVLSWAEQTLQRRGRLNVRPSGTQPMLRVMVEADDYALRDDVADKIVETLERCSGGKVYSRVDLTHALGD
jgi:phosphoglucosamine mutase